jgi:hypothetical protein
MKIKTRPDDAGMLANDELLQMNGWLAELRDEDRAESGDGRTESGDDGRADSRNDGYAWAWDDGRGRSQDDSQAGSRGDGRTESRDEGRLGPSGEAFLRPRDSQAGSPGDGRTESQDDSRLRPRGDGQAQFRHSYPRQEARAATPVTRPAARNGHTARAVIGDQLRLPITWCEMGSCISWFAHPAALGEADIRARAIRAGWRVDAVGLLTCPQCLQTAPRFQSPRPVVPWDRDKAIAMSAPRADEPSTEAVASVARELSHDLRPPASSHQGEVAAASAWTAAVPGEDASGSASPGTSDEIRRPVVDREPEGHLRSGRHRKRLGARLMFASQ